MAVVKPPPKAKPDPNSRNTTGPTPGAAGVNPLAKPRGSESGTQSPAGGEASEFIERKVANMPRMAAFTATPMFKEFIEKVCPRIHLARTSRAILDAFASPDVTAEKVAQCIRGNPYFEYQFLQIVQNLTKREELPKLEGAIVMLGMQNARNTLLGLQLHRSVRGLHPEWDKDGKLKMQPKDLVQFAVKTELHLDLIKDPYADIGYAAGLLFDVLLALSNEIAVGDKKKTAAYIGSLFEHGLRAAKIANLLSQRLPDFSFRKYAFAAGLLHDCGKAVLAMLHPQYLTFTEECQKREIPRGLRLLAEQSTFGMSHALLSGICCHYFSVFRQINKALIYHHDPYLLRPQRNLYQLASVVCLATNAANHIKRVEKADDPVLALWRSPEVRDFKIDNRDLMAAVAKAF